MRSSLQSQVNVNVSTRTCDELTYTNNQIWLKMVSDENRLKRDMLSLKSQVQVGEAKGDFSSWAVGL